MLAESIPLDASQEEGLWCAIILSNNETEKENMAYQAHTNPHFKACKLVVLGDGGGLQALDSIWVLSRFLRGGRRNLPSHFLSFSCQLGHL